MMMAYEANPDHFTIGQLHFPIGVATDKSLPDGLSEVKYELDWMRKMQRSDGSTFHKVAAIQWNGDVSPDDDHLPRYALGTNTYGTAMYGGALAMASRVYAQYNANYAKGLLQDAVFAWDYLEKHPDRIFRFDEGQDNGSGNYNTDTDENQRLWLAAELFRSTGDKKYEQYLMNNGNKLMAEKPCMFGWGNTQALAQFAYLNTAAADPEYKAKVKSAFLATADEILTKIKQDGFNCALSPWEYCWASTKGDVTQGNFLLMANEIQPNKAYVDGALAQVHYLLGRNSLDRSFLTGIGSNPPKHAHSRIMGSTGVLIPGLMVGGPNQYEGGDPEQTALVKGKNLPPAKCYVDSHGSWSTNEYAIDYTATAAYALAWFVKPAADK